MEPPHLYFLMGVVCHMEMDLPPCIEVMLSILDDAIFQNIGKYWFEKQNLPSGNQTWQLNAIENGPFIGDFLIESPISSGFPVATFDYQRV